MTGLSGPEASFMLWMDSVGAPTPEREYQFAPPRRWRFDFAWPEHKFAVEVEGITWYGRLIGRHQQRSGFERDAEKYETALLAGWRVYRVPHTWVAISGRHIWRDKTLDVIWQHIMPKPPRPPAGGSGLQKVR